MQKNLDLNQKITSLTFGPEAKLTKLNRSVINFILILGGAWLIALSAQLRVDLQPFSLVPITAQTLVVMLIGCFYRPMNAALSTLTYIGLGTLGVPVFASKVAGLGLITGATGGYLAGFVIAATTMAMVKLRVRRLIQNSFAANLSLLVMGELIIYAFGVAWLSQWTGLQMALVTGVLPFLPGALVKLGMASAILQISEKR